MLVRRTAAALLAGALLLAGCSDDPEPRFEPTESPSPTESETSAEPQAQSPEEFIREWVSLHADMQNTGETDRFLMISPKCSACVELADLVDRYYAAGGYIKTAGWTLRSLERTSRTGNTLEYQADIDSAKTMYAEAEGAQQETLPAGNGRELFVVEKASDGWRMSEIAELSR